MKVVEEEEEEEEEITTKDAQNKIIRQKLEICCETSTFCVVAPKRQHKSHINIIYDNVLFRDVNRRIMMAAEVLILSSVSRLRCGGFIMMQL